jgi:hypothetical protein
VGYNDTQQTGLFFTAASDLTGYSYSTDGGASFTDGGTLPNTPEFVNLGDPWLASTRAGDMYYSTLADDALNLNVDVAVAKSADGGRTWGTPVPVYRPPISVIYLADKPALATGADPAAKTRDDLYDTWDDFAFTPSGQFFAGLPVAHSTDGGATWQLVYAKRFNLTQCDRVLLQAVHRGHAHRQPRERHPLRGGRKDRDQRPELRRHAAGAV